MKKALCTLFVLGFLSVLYEQYQLGNAQDQPAAKDKSSHKVQFIEVEKGVALEVLDWGGKGTALVLIPGGGLDAHEFDDFAPKLTLSHHVYGITRRGFGASSAPTPDGANYSSDRLGDDILAVAEALALNRPVLVGHSLGGVELSSVGSRFPQKVAGLIYLEAAYSYAYYSQPLGDPILDMLDLHGRLNEVMAKGLGSSQQLEQLKGSTDQLARSLQALQTQRSLMPPPPPRPADAPPPPPVGMAIALERTRYTALQVPILAIFADPHDFGSLYQKNPSAGAAVVANDFATTSAQADALQAGVPSAHIIRIPNADHDIFKSNEGQVIKEMNAFIDSLH